MDECSFLRIVPALVQQYLGTNYKVIRVKVGEIICNLNQVSQSSDLCTYGDTVLTDQRGCAGSICGQGWPLFVEVLTDLCWLSGL